MAGSKPVGSFTLLKKEVKRIFDEGLLLSSYNIYSQFTPRQMEDFILELVALEIAYHAGGLSNYELTKKWTELIWDVGELKRRGEGEGSAAGPQLRVRFVPAALLAMLRTALALQCVSKARGWAGHVDR
jgi:hypothetical protein